MEIDFEKYSPEDLHSALATIDKEEYPENYRKLMAALRKKESDPEPQPNGRGKDSWRTDWRNNPDAVMEPLRKVKSGYALVFMFVVSLCAVAGLSTGHLWIPSKNGIFIDGVWARILSALILALTGYMAIRAIVKKGS